MRDSAGDVLEKELAPVPVTTVDPVLEDDRLYRELWPVVRGMLRRRYAGLQEVEELYQDAWVELLAYRARGNEVRDVGALLTSIADRRAKDRLRKIKPIAVEPTSAVFDRRPDVSALPDERVEVRLEAAQIRQVIDALDEREAAALKLRYDANLDSREVAKRLGVSAKRLEKIMTSAYRSVAEALTVGRDGESPWSRRQRSLLLACEMGFASAAQRRRAQQMLASDPKCRATLIELRTALRDVAAVLPWPALAVEEDRLTIGVDAADQALDGVGKTVQAGRHTAIRIVENVAPSGTVDPAVAGAAAVTTGVAVKAVAACLIASGTVAACFALTDDPDALRTDVGRKTPLSRVIEPARTNATVVRAASPAPQRSAPPARSQARAPRQTTSSSSYQRDPSPTPSGSQEFEPGAVGSAAATRQPASAPIDGGGEFLP